ncbi:hypothetical protein LTR09_002078 [Extremus antarcticus]|uniref:Uncharacterized protein n=1 Tax=Extremus antarcticus TaxID=702011 RepID=A0AAJ0GGD7_9PEZI|nr:hypothetical protein LTR09_002078 [Extremus antarcticus]
MPFDLLWAGDAVPPATIRNDDDAPELSFGVELEYMWASLDTRDNIAIYHGMELGGLGPEAVHAVLKEDMHAKCRTCGQTIAFKLPVVHDWYIQWQRRDPDYNFWSVVVEDKWDGKEVEALGSRKYNYIRVGVEIRSRILSRRRDLLIPSIAGSTHQHQLTWDQEISGVLDLLRKRFCTFDQDKQNEYLYANCSSSMHVHVGNYRQGFELDDIKKVLCLNIACERLIDQVHAPLRIDGFQGINRSNMLTINDRQMNKAYNQPLSSGLQYRAFARQAADRTGGEISRDYRTSTSNEYTYPRSHFDKPDIYKACRAYDIDSWMLLIREAPLLLDIRDNLFPVVWRNTNVNVSNLLDPSCLRDKKKLTLEFRQPDGSLQNDRVLSYVDYFTRQVAYCQSNAWSEIMRQIGPDGPLRQADATPVRLCETLGCDRTTLKHYKDCSDQQYTKSIRHEECRRARQVSRSGNLLAGLAIKTIEEERSTMDVINRSKATNEKLRYGGYGLFPEGLARKLLGPGVEDSEVKPITLGSDQSDRWVSDSNKYKFTNQYHVPSAGSSLVSSPAVAPATGSA